MYKLFSVTEANNLIPVVDELLGDIQEAVQDTLRLRDEIAKLSSHSVAARNKAQEIAFFVALGSRNQGATGLLGRLFKRRRHGRRGFPESGRGRSRLPELGKRSGRDYALPPPQRRLEVASRRRSCRTFGFVVGSRPL